MLTLIGSLNCIGQSTKLNDTQVKNTLAYMLADIAHKDSVIASADSLITELKIYNNLLYVSNERYKEQIKLLQENIKYQNPVLTQKNILLTSENKKLKRKVILWKSITISIPVAAFATLILLK